MKEDEIRMIRSMTGFGRGESILDGRKFIVEIKTVNHRYGDFNVRLPRKFNFLEPKIKTSIKEFVSRGKADVSITYEDGSEACNSVKVNTPLAHDYLEKLRELGNECNLKDDLSLAFISRLPDVIRLEDQSVEEEVLWGILSQAITEAGHQLVAMRQAEGDQLYKDLMFKLETMEKLTNELELRAPLVVEEYRQKLTERLEELLDDHNIDENRITTEIAIFADRAAIDEELVRLKSHIVQMREMLLLKDPVGRKLDFLAQEMNREANTTASKSNDIATTKLAIGLKAEIEKIREQIQNIE